MELNLPPSIQAFKTASQNLDNNKEKKKERKLKNLINSAKEAITAQEMASVVEQIPDTLLKSKVAGLIAWDLGDKYAKGIYEALKHLIHKYPRGGIIEPEQQEVYDALVEIGYSKVNATKMSTCLDDEEDDPE